MEASSSDSDCTSKWLLSPHTMLIIISYSFNQLTIPAEYWIDWFLGAQGNEFFCEIDDEFLSDRFNMTGLNTEVVYYQYALNLIMDAFGKFSRNFSGYCEG